MNARRRFVVVSYNVHCCIGRDRRFLPGRIADVLAPLEADFIGLQEVQERRYEGTTVSTFLANRLGMHACRGPTLQRETDAYGNVLLSRWPARRMVRHDISVIGREPRGAIEADFELAGRTVRFFVTHLGLSAAERRAQLRALLPRLAAQDADLRVLAGDLNEWRPRASTLRLLRRTFGAVPKRRTFPARAPVLALDRMYVSPASSLLRLTVVNGPQARVASDHLPLRGDIELPP